MIENEHILLYVDKPNYEYIFHPNAPLVLGKEPKIGVKSIFMWYTVPNISPRYDNNKVKIYYNGEWKEIEIPEGMYEVHRIGNYLNRKIQNNNDAAELNESLDTIINIDVDKATFHCIVKLTQGVQIDFSQGNLHKLLGLDPKIYNKTVEKGSNFINITRGVDQIFIRCNLVDRPYQYEYNDVLIDIPSSDPGRAIHIHHDPLEYYNCKNKIIRSIQIKVTDQHGNILELSEPMLLKISFKYKKD